MAKKIVSVLLVALASLQVIQALGLYDTPFPAPLDRESDDPLNILIPLSDSWNISTRWLTALKSSYSQIVRYEIEDTLERRLVYFTDSVDKGASLYKSEIVEILAVNSPKCTQETLKTINQTVSRSEEQLKQCTVGLKSLRNTYRSSLAQIMESITQQTEEPFYASCDQEYNQRQTLTNYNRARKCYNSKLQKVLDNIYYKSGAQLLKAVQEMREAVKRARDESYACAKRALSPSTEQTIMAAIATLKRDCGVPAPLERQKRGFGKKFKKFFKKAKKGVKKICSKVPCKIGYSIPFGK